jgi:hypothetical protein
LIATNRFLGSLTAAERLAVQLTVVNPRKRFAERIRLHQLAARPTTAVTRPLKDLLHRDGAQCLSLGRGAGYIQPVRRDDSPRSWHIGGWAGACVKEAVSRRVVVGPRQEKDKPGSYSWRR